MVFQYVPSWGESVPDAWTPQTCVRDSQIERAKNSCTKNITSSDSAKRSTAYHVMRVLQCLVWTGYAPMCVFVLIFFALRCCNRNSHLYVKGNCHVVMVVETLNQRHWRWFNVATTSCVQWLVLYIKWKVTASFCSWITPFLFSESIQNKYAKYAPEVASSKLSEWILSYVVFCTLWQYRVRKKPVIDLGSTAHSIPLNSFKYCICADTMTNFPGGGLTC